MASQGRRRRLEARMEPEQERLRRQIRLLQGLINDHKNAHGNAPVPPPPASLSRWRNPKLPTFHSQTAFGTRYSQQPSRDFSSGPANATTWRKKYSLVNAPPRPALPSASGVSPSASWASRSHASREAPEPQLMLSEAAAAVSSAKANARLPASSVAGDAAGSSFHPGYSGSRRGPLASRGKLPTAPWPSNADLSRKKEWCASTLSLSPCGKTPATAGNNRPATGQKKPVGRSELAASLGRTISESAVVLKSEPRRSLASPEQGSGSLPIWKKPTLQASPLSGSHRQPSPAGTVKLSPARSADLSAGCARSGEEASSSTGRSLAPNKPAVVLVQKSSSVPASVRSSRFKRANYTWVANPSKSPRSVRRWAVSRASEGTPKLAACAPAASPKAQSRGANLDLGAKPKKSSPHSKLAVSASQYKWKAASAKSAPPPSTSASVFTWKRKEGVRPGDAPGVVAASTSLQTLRRLPLGHGHLAQGSPRAFFGTTSFFNYKLRSWPRIIKRKGSVSSPTLLLKSRYCLRKRHATRGRSSPTARRTGTKGLVQIGKHRLRRLPASRVPGSPKEGSSFLLVTSPVSHRVVNTRYRLVKKSAGSPLISAAPGAGPSHGWKARRLSLSRSLTSNSTRHSSPGSKSQAVQHRCIEGVMYRVSANKLSKTSSPPSRSMEVVTRSQARGAARPDSAPGAPGYSPPSWPSRSITSRYIASRAVQRSLAIIRQAKQRKERKKEYCMYYNRFGKCNRGESCPYIHDPEKVAVCTRFLRGACKKTDGTCPFAHKISKDKMPVCSYFLRGICSNSDCPYSHVYVSRKAEVCPEFLKGYCPLGEKCKKKHTLVCPDFSKHGVCPKGSRCKLQHPQKKRLATQAGVRDSCPAEQGNYAKQTLRRKGEEEEEGATPGAACWHLRILPQSSRLTKQPSFISLQSPPASPQEEGPKAERSGEEAGKPLQIKPRL